MTVFYITAIPVPKSTSITTLDGVPRVDMAKFNTRADAEAHASKYLHPAHFADQRIEERPE
jgi:hypothetical protein